MMYPPKPPIPPEMPLIRKEGTMEQRCDWKRIAKDYSQRLKKVLRKNGGTNNQLDMSDAIIKRRIQVLLDYTDQVIDRYKAVPGYELEKKDQTGREFICFNFFPITTYNQMERRAYLLFAASIWILDEILSDRTKRIPLYMILPRDDYDIDETWNEPDVWHACYDDDLISSVKHVLHRRNEDIAENETEDDKTERVIINSLIATDGQHIDVPSRRAFEKLMALIPKESIDRAVAYFEELFWMWTDRYFDCLVPLDAAIQEATEKANQLAEEYNRQRQELIHAVKNMKDQQEKEKKQPGKPVFNPLLMNPVPSAMKNPLQIFNSLSGFGNLPGKPFANAMRNDPVQKVF